MGIYQSGTALLSVEKDGDDDSSSSLYVSINCLSGIDKNDYGGQDWLQRSTSELAAFCDWLPPQCYRMKHGDKIVMKVRFEQSFWRGDGYTTDDDEELIFEHVKTLYKSRGEDESRRQRKRYYRQKSPLKYGGKIKPSKKQLLEMGYTESEMVHFT